MGLSVLDSVHTAELNLIALPAGRQAYGLFHMSARGKPIWDTNNAIYYIKSVCVIPLE